MKTHEQLYWYGDSPTPCLVDWKNPHATALLGLSVTHGIRFKSIIYINFSVLARRLLYPY